MTPTDNATQAKPDKKTYDMDYQLKRMNGEPLQQDGKPLTAGTIIVDVLSANYVDEKIDGSQKVDRYKLAVRINEGGPQPLSPKEIVLIQQLLAKTMGPLIVGPLYELLEA
ncbi:MAG: hypothetical protein PSY14_06870 [bacterium]|nr:hypothetical protein [bacterium]